MEKILSDSFDKSGQSLHPRECSCDSCRFNPEAETEISSIQGSSALGGGYLSTNGLISPAFSAHTANALNASGSETLEYYIHTGLGHTTFEDNTYGYSLGHSPEEANFIRSIFNRIDPYIDLDFSESNDWNGTTFDIYCLDSYSTWDNNVVGMVNNQGYGPSAYWDIYWLDTDGAPSLNDFDACTIVHEIGHALGLSHPYEDPTNGNWNTDDTVMSYNISPDGWNTWFSDTDIAALIEIWGAENDQLVSSLIGTAGADLITGLAGKVHSETIDGGDGNDTLRGYGGGDFLNGGSGNDLMGGNFGRDTLVGGAGNDVMNGGQGGDDISGGDGADIIRGGGGKNSINAGANDLDMDEIYIHADFELYGRPIDGSYADLLNDLEANDRIYIHGVEDRQLSFKAASLPSNGEQGVGIYANGSLEAVVTGGLGVDQVNAMTEGGFF